MAELILLISTGQDNFHELARNSPLLIADLLNLALFCCARQEGMRCNATKKCEICQTLCADRVQIS